MGLFSNFGRPEAPAHEWSVWFLEEQQAVKYTTNPMLLSVLLAAAPELSNDAKIAIEDAVSRGKYKIAPGTSRDGESGYVLLVFYETPSGRGR